MVQHNRSVFQIVIPFRENRDWEQWVLLSSDRHLDNPKSDHKLQIKHLEEVKERDAFVIDAGDMLDAMGAKFDRRSSKEGVRPEHQRDNYFDAIVDSAVEFFSPYARHLAIFGEGNHETAVTKHHEISLTDRFVALINARGGRVHKAGYGGFAVFTFRPMRNGQLRDGITRITLRFEHGAGGDAAVTKGMIAAQRRAVIYRDADIVFAGHIHQHWVSPFIQVGVNRDFSVYQVKQLHIQLPCYKNEFEDGYGGYHIEKGRGPRPLGAVWLRFYWCRQEQRVKFEAKWAD